MAELDPQIVQEFTKVNQRLDRVLRLLDGDPNDDVTGIRPRLTLVEARVKALPDDLVLRVSKLEEGLVAEREKRIHYEQRWMGAKIVLSAFGVTSVASLGMMIRMLWGAG